MKAGVALNPHTPVHLLEDILEECDYVLLMSVNPGFGGQKFIENCVKKVSVLKEMILKRGLSTLIEVDGGVNRHNAPILAAAGADALVAGSSVFNAQDPMAEIIALKG
jgi:ribulose-phosphate 3-epimerase